MQRRTRSGAIGGSRDELARLGQPIAPSTGWEILHAASIGPVPRRTGPSWCEFLTAQAEGIIAADLFRIDTVTGSRLYALVFLEHGTRCLHSVLPRRRA